MRKSTLKKGRSRRLTYRFRELHEDRPLKVVEPHHVFLRKLKAEDIDGEIYKSCEAASVVEEMYFSSTW